VSSALVGVIVTILLGPLRPTPRLRRPRRSLSALGSLIGDRVERTLSTWRSVPREAESLPDLIELTARSRRAGQALLPSLVDASRAVPTAGLGPALARVEAGAGLGPALDDWAGSIGHPDAYLVVAVLLLGDETGAAVAARLDRTAVTLRQRAALADEVRALTAQTRASATVVALAPIAFALVVAATDDRFIELTLGTGIGRLSLAAGLVLDAIGVWWMRRLTRVDA
jgi:tight adherence protein B